MEVLIEGASAYDLCELSVLSVDVENWRVERSVFVGFASADFEQFAYHSIVAENCLQVEPSDMMT